MEHYDQCLSLNLLIEHCFTIFVWSANVVWDLNFLKMVTYAKTAAFSENSKKNTTKKTHLLKIHFFWFFSSLRRIWCTLIICESLCSIVWKWMITFVIFFSLFWCRYLEISLVIIFITLTHFPFDDCDVIVVITTLFSVLVSLYIDVHKSSL